MGDDPGSERRSRLGGDPGGRDGGGRVGWEPFDPRYETRIRALLLREIGRRGLRGAIGFQAAEDACILALERLCAQPAARSRMPICLGAGLRVLVRWCCADVLERRARAPGRILSLGAAGEPAIRVPHDDRIEEVFRAVQRSLHATPARDRRLLVERHGRGSDLESIARAESIGVSRVSYLLARSVKAFLERCRRFLPSLPAPGDPKRDRRLASALFEIARRYAERFPEEGRDLEALFTDPPLGCRKRPRRPRR